MPSISLKAHCDGKTVRLDELFELEEGAQLIVTVLEPDSQDPDRAGWIDLSAQGLARAYGDSEPEYSSADVIP
jgi:hypothetical protein